MIHKHVLAFTVRLERLVSAFAGSVTRRHEDAERGGSTVEWVILAAVVFLLALAVGAKITSVVNDQLAKIK